MSNLFDSMDGTTFGDVRELVSYLAWCPEANRYVLKKEVMTDLRIQDERSYRRFDEYNVRMSTIVYTDATATRRTEYHVVVLDTIEIQPEKETRQ